MLSNLSIKDNLDVSRYGGKLHIDHSSIEYICDTNTVVAIDVETDEKDNFVGIGWTVDGVNIHYQTCKPLRILCKVIGHNVKADVKWLKAWGVDINPEQIYGDTMLMSYCQDPTKEKHGLKGLANELLGIDYPAYSDIVGKGHKRTTLDKQPIQTVANYCGLDVLATFRLYKYFQEKLSRNQRLLYENLEMPLMRLLYCMELQGIHIDTAHLRNLSKEFSYTIGTLQQKLGSDINWNSPKQVGEKLKIKSTAKKILTTLDSPIAKLLLEYRELTKLKSTYVDALLEQQKDGRIYTTFNQLIDTGRLSSYGPNLQNIPTRTERGDLLRRAFIPSTACIFIDADYSQIEYRLLAHFSQEPSLLKFYNEGGNDIHEETGRLLGVSRELGKTLNFASIYGAGAKKIVQTVNTNSTEKITEDQAQEFLDLYWSKLPRVHYWVEQTKEFARKNGVFQTLSGQCYKLKYIYDADRMKRWYSERQAVNGVIQGSAAYIIKLAMLELEKKGFIPLLQVHDELLFESNECPHALSHLTIKNIMENVVKLSVPLVVAVGIGSTWQEAKKNGK